MSRASITSLPFELLTLVIRHVSPDTSSLASLAAVSQTWNSATTPFLYRNFRQYETDRREHAVYHFTHTILARPDLGKHVRHLALGRLRSLGREKLDIHAHFLFLCVDFINRLFGSWLGRVLCDETRYAWISQFEELLPDTFQSILICALPNLETLYLEDDPQMIFVWQIFNAASKLVPTKHLGSQTITQEIPFLRLHSIRLGMHRRIIKDNIYDFHGYFKLPNISKLELGNAYGTWRDQNPELHEWTKSPSSSSIQHLSLQHCTFSAECLTSVVGLCARLKQFHYSSGCHNTHECSPQHILEQLLPHAKTLETVGISFLRLKPALSRGRCRLDSGLSMLTKLKRLILSYDAMFVRGIRQDIIIPGYSGTDIPSDPIEEPVHLSEMLPSSLNTFELLNCSPNIIPHIQDLDNAKRAGHLPHLQLVKLSFAEGNIHPSEFEHMRVFGVDVDCQVSDRFCDVCPECSQESGKSASDSIMHSNIFSDEMMLPYHATTVTSPPTRSGWL